MVGEGLRTEARQRGIVWAFKSGITSCRDFRRSVSPVKPAVEGDCDFPQRRTAYKAQRGLDVGEGVGLALDKRNLGSGQDDRLREVAQHERQCRGGVGHGVGAVENDERIVVVPSVNQMRGNSGPITRRGLRTVDRNTECLDFEIGQYGIHGSQFLGENLGQVRLRC